MALQPLVKRTTKGTLFWRTALLVCLDLGLFLWVSGEGARLQLLFGAAVFFMCLAVLVFGDGNIVRALKALG